MTRTIPPSFVEIGPKLRVVAPLTWEWPKTAKNRGELGNGKFFGGGSDGKVVAPGILVICPSDKNRDDHTKN